MAHNRGFEDDCNFPSISVVSWTSIELQILLLRLESLLILPGSMRSFQNLEKDLKLLSLRPAKSPI